MPRKWWIPYRGNRWVGKRAAKWLPMGSGMFEVLTGDRRFVMSFKPFRGVFAFEVYTKTWGLGAPDGTLLEQRRRPDVKKVTLAKRSSVKHLAALESHFFRDLQPIVDHLGRLTYDDDSPRQPGYLGVWTQGSAWVARITDKDADATLTAEGRTLDEALGVLAMLLGADDAPWEPAARRKKKGT